MIDKNDLSVDISRLNEPIDIEQFNSNNAPGFPAKNLSENLSVWAYSETTLPTRFGEFNVYVFRNSRDSKEHLAIVKGDIRGKSEVLTRLHSECLTSEVLGSLKCDCREQLEAALQRIDTEGSGVVLYLRQEGRGIGLGNKILAYGLQERGLDTVEANKMLGFPDDLRDYQVAALILENLEVDSVRLMTNNPAKVNGLDGYGIDVVERVPLQIVPNSVNNFYLETKKRKSGHLLELVG